MSLLPEAARIARLPPPKVLGLPPPLPVNTYLGTYLSPVTATFALSKQDDPIHLSSQSVRFAFHRLTGRTNKQTTGCTSLRSEVVIFFFFDNTYTLRSCVCGRAGLDGRPPVRPTRRDLLFVCLSLCSLERCRKNRGQLPSRPPVLFLHCRPKGNTNLRPVAIAIQRARKVPPGFIEQSWSTWRLQTLPRPHPQPPSIVTDQLRHITAGGHLLATSASHWARATLTGTWGSSPDIPKPSLPYRVCPPRAS